VRSRTCRGQAEAAGFDAIITTEQNLKYQQNLSARRISIIVLCTTIWLRIEKSIHAVTKALDPASPRSYSEIHIA
jgi:hypothetical protein